MKLITWNVNSIRSRAERLVELLRRHRPDVLCLQELKCVDEQVPLDIIEAEGYLCATHGQKTYNGVAILTRNSVDDVQRGFADDLEPDPQARLISCVVRGVRIICAYVPNGSELGSEKWMYKMAWMRRLRAMLDASFSAAEPVILTGDFNVAPRASDVAFPERWIDSVLFSQEARDALEHIRAFGFADTFADRHPEGGVYSWWDYRNLAFPKGDGLRIAHVFATPPIAALCTAAAIDREERKGKGASDHAPVIAEFNLP